MQPESISPELFNPRRELFSENVGASEPRSLGFEHVRQERERPSIENQGKYEANKYVNGQRDKLTA